MEFEEVLNRLNDSGSRGRYMTETFLINLFSIHIKKQGKELIEQDNKNTVDFDAFAPNGFDEFDTPTFIEFTSSASIKKILWRLNVFRNNQLKDNSSQLLIVSLRPLTSKTMEQMIQETSNIKYPITIWGPKEIEIIANQNVDEVRKIGDNLFTLRLESALNKEQENWKDKRNKIINDVKASYESGQFSLFLGAGVSSSAGLPDWDTLLNSLFVSLLTSELDQHKKIESSEISSIVKRLREVDEPSALMSARYIRKGMANSGTTEQSQFIETVTNQLYELRNKRRSLDSKLIKSIAAMCMPGRTGAKVKSVVTYNFDDLIERELINREIVHRTIFEEIEIPSPEELPLYHVHGFLPEDRTQYSNLDRSTLVFSEEGYHKIYSEPYHWSNLVQLNNLKESTCIMIGLSMTDPNLRRLLEIAAMSIDKPKHYAFMQRIDMDEFSKEDSKKIVSAPLGTIKTFLDRHHSLNEEVLKELGVHIIWYENYDDIPKILINIAKGI